MVPSGLWDGYRVTKVSDGDFRGVIDHAEQHIQSTECLGYGLVVIVWVSAFDFLRWVAGLAKKKGFETRMGWIFSFHTSLLVALWGYRPC